jgi:hypothetical protein
MCVRTHVYVYTRIHIYMCVCVGVGVGVGGCVWVCVWVGGWVNAYKTCAILMSLCILKMCACVYIHTYMHTIYTYTNKHIFK